MRMFLWLIIFLLPTPVLAGTLSVFPPSIEPGGAAFVVWKGEPVSLGVGRFGEDFFYFRPNTEGAVALIGADLEKAPGTYSIKVALTDPRGQVSFLEASIEIVAADRPVERLSLPSALVSPRQPEALTRIARERRMLTELFARNSGPPLWDSFIQPVDDPVNSNFGLRRVLNGRPASPHAGVDFRSPAGTPVKAASSGKTAFAGELYFTGKTVIIDHGEGLYSLYAHLQSLFCRPGQLVRGGDILGRVGSTGRSTGAHLHWGIKLLGARIDPLNLLQLFGGERP